VTDEGKIQLGIQA